MRLVTGQPVALPERMQTQIAAAEWLVAMLQPASDQRLGIAHRDQKSGPVQPSASRVEKLTLDFDMMTEQHPAGEAGQSGDLALFLRLESGAADFVWSLQLHGLTGRTEIKKSTEGRRQALEETNESAF